MARKPTGQVLPPKGKQRSWALRFTAHKKRHFVSLGRPEDGWNRQRAERELRGILADLERGIWRPDQTQEAPEPIPEPTFHEFASDWLKGHEPGLAPKTITDYRWALELHLLPVFAQHRLSEITAEEIDRYRAEKLREGKLGPNAVNKTIVRLAQILEVAVEYGRIPQNPAKSRRRRAKATEPRRSWVEPEQLPALLAAADQFLRPILVTMAGAGLRVGEAVALDWADVDLATGTLTVRESKTAAGENRQVDLPVGLREELTEWKQRSPMTGRSDPVFISSAREGSHSRQTERNVQARMKTAIREANAALSSNGGSPISERVSPHSLRRTFASMRAALRMIWSTSQSRAAGPITGSSSVSTRRQRSDGNASPVRVWRLLSRRWSGRRSEQCPLKRQKKAESRFRPPFQTTPQEKRRSRETTLRS